MKGKDEGEEGGEGRGEKKRSMAGQSDYESLKRERRGKWPGCEVWTVTESFRGVSPVDRGC